MIDWVELLNRFLLSIPIVLVWSAAWWVAGRTARRRRRRNTIGSRDNAYDACMLARRLRRPGPYYPTDYTEAARLLDAYAELITGEPSDDDGHGPAPPPLPTWRGYH